MSPSLASDDVMNLANAYAVFSGKLATVAVPRADLAITPSDLSHVCVC